MSMDSTILDKPYLRKFGLTLSFVFLGIFGVVLPFLFKKPMAMWPFVVGGIILVPAIVQPLLLKVIYTPWMKLGTVLGFINTRIILGVIFFALITPIGLLMRLCGNDPMNQKYNKSLKSYRKLTPPQNASHMEKPF